MKRIAIDTDSVVGQNTRFWQAAGDDLLYWLTPRPEGQAFLDRIAQTKSCRMLRNHHTFCDMVRHDVHLSAECYDEDEQGNGVYDFSFINSIYAEFVKRGLKPYVECDFFPAKLGSKADPNPDGTAAVINRTAGPKDWTKWHDLLVAFVRNLIDTFGLDEVRTWYFEVWNEPDGWPADDVDTFYRMYDVFVDAVKGVDSQLKVGGPAVFTQSFLTGFLRHVAEGTNHVTGRRGTPIDFISYHQYAMIGAWLDAHPLIRPCTQAVLYDNVWIRAQLKSLGLENVEFHLNEWGVCNNYYRTVDEHPALEYRNTEFSALFLVKLVHNFYAIGDMLDFPLSLMLYWGTAWEPSFDRMFLGVRSLMTGGDIPKPIQTGFEMLAKLGDERLKVEGARPGESIGVLATRRGRSRIQFLAYNFNELDDEVSGSDDIEIRLANLPDGKKLQASLYRLDREHHNTFRAWQKQGSPRTPGETDLAALRQVAELTGETREIEIDNTTAAIPLALPRHGMCLVTADVV